MRTAYVIFLFLVSVGVLKSQSKEELIDKILCRSNSWIEIENVIDIILKSDVQKYIPLGFPLKEKYRISSSFGWRQDPILGTKKHHSGIDLAAEYASIVYSTGSGKVIFSGEKGGYGKTIVIQHKYGFKTYYSHLTFLYVQKGRFIKRDDAIGFVGSTGRSTGNHLHYEIRKNGIPIDPIRFLRCKTANR